MSRSFNGSSDKLSYAGAAITATPLTMAAWIKRGTAGTSAGTVMFLGNSGSVGNVNHWRVNRAFTDDGNASVTASTCGPTSGASNATCTRSITDWPEDTWGHVAGVFGSDTSRYGYAQGVASTETTASKTPSGANITTLGKQDNITGASWFSGEMAEAAIWNVALDAAEIAALAAGVCPLLVRPTSLVSYWPIIGQYSPEIDMKGGYGLTVTGTSTANHPRIYRANGPLILGVPAAVVAAAQQHLMLLGVGC